MLNIRLRAHRTMILKNFLCEFLSLGLLDLGNASRRFGSKQTTTPVTTDLLEAVVVVVLDSLNKFGQVQLVVRINLRIKKN